MRVNLSRALPLSISALLTLWVALDPAIIWVRDYLLYNATWVIALCITIASPLSNHRTTVAITSLAIFSWGCGSFLASAGEFGLEGFNSDLLSQICYCIFYPLLLTAIPRLFGQKSTFSAMETLDSAIVGLGFTSLSAAFLATTIFKSGYIFSDNHFFLLFYPVGDTALLVAVILLFIYLPTSWRKFTLLFGIVTFCITDLFYLFQSTRDQYFVGGIIDYGWLIGISLISLAFSFPIQEPINALSIHPALIAISIFLSPILLAVSAVRPSLFPPYVVIACLATLLLAFIRMSRALRESRALKHERELARTDELTSLANRRRMMSEIEAFSEVEGALLLLDLNKFKPVNDLYGHDMGDLILKEVARRFSRFANSQDVLARLGGDEFALLVRGDREHTLDIAYALKASMSYPFLIKGKSLLVGVSVGHAFNDGQGRLLERADKAMYQAKNSLTGVVSATAL